MNVKVSVIVPVYNAEHYLPFCIASLKEQTLQDCEFIFVDDGSTDGSRKIIEDYQKKDDRIVFVHQENKGVSVARNTGLTLAKGSYIGFVDADDTVAPGFYEQLYSKALLFDSEVVVSNFITQMGNELIPSKAFFDTDVTYDEVFIKHTLVPFCIRQDDFNPVWNKLYKKDTILEHSIHFTEGVSHGEDALFNLKVLGKIKRILFTDSAGYYYREVPDSATRNCISKDFFQKALDVFRYDYQSDYELAISIDELMLLKSIRFVTASVSLIHLSFKEREVSFWRRYQYVKKIIHHPVLQDALSKYWDVLLQYKNRYERFIFKQIKSKSMFSLVLAVHYSNYRNKK